MDLRGGRRSEGKTTVKGGNDKGATAITSLRDALQIPKGYVNPYWEASHSQGERRKDRIGITIDETFTGHLKESRSMGGTKRKALM